MCFDIQLCSSFIILLLGSTAPHRNCSVEIIIAHHRTSYIARVSSSLFASFLFFELPQRDPFVQTKQHIILFTLYKLYNIPSIHTHYMHIWCGMQHFPVDRPTIRPLHPPTNLRITQPTDNQPLSHPIPYSDPMPSSSLYMRKTAHSSSVCRPRSLLSHHLPHFV